MVPIDDPNQATVVFQSPDDLGRLLLAEADAPDQRFTHFQSVEWGEK